MRQAFGDSAANPFIIRAFLCVGAISCLVYNKYKNHENYHPVEFIFLLNTYRENRGF